MTSSIAENLSKLQNHQGMIILIPASLRSEFDWLCQTPTCNYSLQVRSGREVLSYAGGLDTAMPNMGLTSWNGAKAHQGMLKFAKNYLAEEELCNLIWILTIIKGKGLR